MPKKQAGENSKKVAGNAKVLYNPDVKGHDQQSVLMLPTEN